VVREVDGLVVGETEEFVVVEGDCGVGEDEMVGLVSKP
jgi:hypothetical protein